MKVWAAVITHGHGSDLYVHTSEQERMRAIANYCRSWWYHESVLEDVEMPDEDDEVASLYFDTVDYEHVDYYDGMEVEA